MSWLEMGDTAKENGPEAVRYLLRQIEVEKGLTELRRRADKEIIEASERVICDLKKWLAKEKEG